MCDSSVKIESALGTLRNASTGMVIDALAMAGIKGGVRGIRPARGLEDAKIVGTAVTVLFSTRRPDSPKLDNYQIIRASKPGSVLVIDGKGVDGHYTGDNQAMCAKRQGLAGIVVFGGARDIAGFRQIGMALYCTGAATAQSDLQPVASNVPVEIGGVMVRPGDIILADEDGVVVIPADSLDAVMDNLKTITDVEEQMEGALQNDAPLEVLAAITAKKKPKKQLSLVP